MRTTSWFLGPIALLVMTSWGVTAMAPARAQGLNLADTSPPSARWQTRLSLGHAGRSRLVGDSPRAVQAAWLSDYDLGSFGLLLPHAQGRFRATGGLLFEASDGISGAIEQPPTAPYIGLGYSGWLTKSGLSFSADIGLSAEYPGGAWRFGRALFGSQASDASWRELRLQPRLQLGVQYRY